MTSTTIYGQTVQDQKMGDTVEDWIRSLGVDPVLVRNVTHQPGRPSFLIFEMYRLSPQGRPFLVDTATGVRPPSIFVKGISERPVAVAAYPLALAFTGQLPSWWRTICVEQDSAKEPILTRPEED